MVEECNRVFEEHIKKRCGWHLNDKETIKICETYKNTLLHCITNNMISPEKTRILEKRREMYMALKEVDNIIGRS
jgi:hypothetical protein